MKSIAFITIVFLIPALVAGQSGARGGNNPARPVLEAKLNLLSPLAGGFGAGIEAPVAGQFTVGVNGELGLQKIAMWDGLRGKYTSFKVVLEGRYYPFQQSHYEPFHGPYAALMAKYQRTAVVASLPEGDFDLLKGTTYAPGVMLGWQFNPMRKYPGFLIDLSAGAVHNFSNAEGTLNAGRRPILFEHNGFLPRVAVTAGISLASRRNAGAPTVKAPPPKKPANADIRFYDRYTRKEIRRIEQALSKKGFNPGKVDGRVDEQTVKAVTRFQKSAGLAQDGLAGEKTLKKLGVEIGKGKN